MQSKLHVNLSQGLIEVEGEASFVKEVYSDFKDSIKARLESSDFEGDSDGSADDDAVETRKPVKPQGAKPKKVRRKRKVSSESNSGASGKGERYKPKLDPNLVLRDLDTFYEKYVPKSNYERVLIFADFLRTELSIEPCSADAIYTCFQKLKHKSKVPTAFVQLLVDSRGEKAFISYENYEEIYLTPNGENHLYHDMEKAKTE